MKPSSENLLLTPVLKISFVIQQLLDAQSIVVLNIVTVLLNDFTIVDFPPRNYVALIFHVQNI